MAQGVVLDIQLDSSQAVSELRSVEQQVPRSMQRIVRDFDRMTKNIMGAAQKGMEKHERTAVRTAALAQEFKNVASEYRKEIREISSVNKKMQNTAAYKALNDAQKKQLELMRKHQKAVLSMRAEMQDMMAAAAQGGKIDVSKLKRSIGQLNSAAKGLNLGQHINAKDFAENIVKQLGAVDFKKVNSKQELKALHNKLQSMVDRQFKGIKVEPITFIQPSYKLQQPSKRDKEQAIKKIYDEIKADKDLQKIFNNYYGKQGYSLEQKLNTDIGAVQTLNKLKEIKNLRLREAQFLKDIAEATKLGNKQNITPEIGNQLRNMLTLKAGKEILSDREFRERSRQLNRVQMLYKAFQETSLDIRDTGRVLRYTNFGEMRPVIRQMLSEFRQTQKEKMANKLVMQDFDEQVNLIKRMNSKIGELTGEAPRFVRLSNARMADVDGAAHLMNERLRHSEETLRKLYSQREKAEKEIQNYGKFNRNISRGMQYRQFDGKDSLIDLEEARQKQLKKDLKKLYDDSMRDIKRYVKDYEDQKKMFVEKVMNDVKAGNQTLRAIGLEQYQNKQLSEQRKRNMANVKREVDAERDFRRQNYLRAAREIDEHANKLEMMENANAKRKADSLRKRAIAIRQGDAIALRNFVDGRDKYLNAYERFLKKDLELLKKQEEQAREQSSLFKRAFGMGELAEVRKRRERLEREIAAFNKSKQEMQTLPGTGGGGVGGGGGRPPRTDKFGRGGFPNTEIRLYQNNVDRLERSARRLRRTFDRLNSAFYTFGAGLGIYSLTQYFDQWVQFTNRIKLVTDSVQELKDVQNELIEVSNRTATSLFSSGGLFEKFSRAGDRFGVSNDMKAALTQLVQQTVIISGSTTEGAKGAIIQFVQGLGTELRGQELASVREQIPRLARAIAEGLDVPISKLKQLGEQGAITGDQIMLALIKQLPVIEAEFKSVSFTISQSFERISNSLSELFGRTLDDMNQQQGVSKFFQSISDAIRDLTKRGTLTELFKSLYELSDLLTTIAKTLATAFLVSKTTSLLTGAGSFAAATVMGTRMNVRDARAESGFGAAAMTLFGGGYYDSQGIRYTRSQRREMLEQNRKDTIWNTEQMERNRDLPESERKELRQMRDVPQRRGSIGRGLEKAGVIGAAIAGLAFALTDSSEALNALMDTILRGFKDFFVTIGKFIDGAAKKLGLYKSVYERELEAADLKFYAAQGRAQLARAAVVPDTSVQGIKSIREERLQGGVNHEGRIALLEPQIERLQAELATIEESGGILGNLFGSDKEEYLRAQLHDLQNQRLEHQKALNKENRMTAEELARQEEISKKIHKLELLKAAASEEDRKRKEKIFEVNTKMDDLATTYLKNTGGMDEIKRKANAELIRESGRLLNQQLELNVGINNYSREIANLERQKAKVDPQNTRRLEEMDDEIADYAKLREEKQKELNDVLKLTEGIPKVLKDLGVGVDLNFALEVKEVIGLLETLDKSFTESGEKLLDFDAKVKLVSMGLLELQRNGEDYSPEEKKIIDVLKEDIRKQRQVTERQTKEIIDSMRAGEAAMLPFLSMRATEVEGNLLMARAQAEREYAEEMTKIEAKYRYKINAIGDPTERSDEDLELMKNYNDALDKAEQKRQVAAERAEEARRTSIVQMNKQISLQEDMNRLEQKSLKLAQDGVGVFNSFYKKGISEVSRKIIEAETQMQEGLIMELTQYMVTVGAWNQDIAELIMQNISKGSLDDLIDYIQEKVDAYADSNEALSLKLKEMLLRIQAAQITGDKAFQNQMEASSNALKLANETMEEEFKRYKENLEEFSGTLNQLASMNASGPMAGVATGIINQISGFKLELAALKNERGKIQREFDQAAMDPTASARLGKLGKARADKGLEIRNKEAEQEIELKKLLRNAEDELAVARMQTEDRFYEFYKYERVHNEDMYQLQLDIMETEDRRTELTQKRIDGIRLSLEETNELAAIEQKLIDQGFSQQRLEAERQIVLERDRALEQNQLVERMLMKHITDQETRNQLSELFLGFREEITDNARLELSIVEQRLTIEEKLATAIRKRVRDQKLAQTGLFSGLQSESAKDRAAAMIDDPLLQNLFSSAQSLRNITQQQNQLTNQYSLDELLAFYSKKNSAGDYLTPEMREGILKFQELYKAESETQTEITNKLVDIKRGQLVDLAEYEDISNRAQVMLNLGQRNSSKVLALLESRRDQAVAEMESAFEMEVQMQAAQERLKDGGFDYEDFYNKKRAEYNRSRIEKIFEIDRQFLKDLREEYGYLQSEIFDITKLSESQFKMLAPLMDGLQEYAELNKKMMTKPSQTPEMKLLETQRLKTEELKKAGEDLLRGDYDMYMQRSANIALLQKYIEYLQLTAKNYGIFAEEQRRSLKETLRLQREQQINSMQQSERDLKIQLEMAQLRKEAILSESQLAEVEHGKRRLLLQQEIADQQEILYLQHQQNLATLEVSGFDPNSVENRGKRQQFEAEYLQQTRLLEIQERQQLAALDGQEQLRKMTEEQNKSIDQMDNALGRLLGTYFSFIGNIFGTIFDAIFGSSKKQEEFNPAKLAEDRIKQLERDKKEIENEINFVLEPNAEHYVNNTNAIINNTKAVNNLTKAFGGDTDPETKTVKKETGGMLYGPSHDNGGIDMGRIAGVKVEAEGGEYIIRKSSVSKLGLGTLNYLNEHGELPYTAKFGGGTGKATILGSILGMLGLSTFGSDEAEAGGPAKFSPDSLMMKFERASKMIGHDRRMMDTRSIEQGITNFSLILDAMSETSALGFKVKRDAQGKVIPMFDRNRMIMPAYQDFWSKALSSPAYNGMREDAVRDLFYQMYEKEVKGYRFEKRFGGYTATNVHDKEIEVLLNTNPDQNSIDVSFEYLEPGNTSGVGDYIDRSSKMGIKNLSGLNLAMSTGSTVMKGIEDAVSTYKPYLLTYQAIMDGKTPESGVMKRSILYRQWLSLFEHPDYQGPARMYNLRAPDDMMAFFGKSPEGFLTRYLFEKYPDVSPDDVINGMYLSRAFDYEDRTNDMFEYGLDVIPYLTRQFGGAHQSATHAQKAVALGRYYQQLPKVHAMTIDPDFRRGVFNLIGNDFSAPLDQLDDVLLTRGLNELTANGSIGEDSLLQHLLFRNVSYATTGDEVYRDIIKNGGGRIGRNELIRLKNDLYDYQDFMVTHDSQYSNYFKLFNEIGNRIHRMTDGSVVFANSVNASDKRGLLRIDDTSQAEPFANIRQAFLYKHYLAEIFQKKAERLEEFSDAWLSAGSSAELMTFEEVWDHFRTGRLNPPEPPQLYGKGGMIGCAPKKTPTARYGDGGLNIWNQLLQIGAKSNWQQFKDYIPSSMQDIFFKDSALYDYGKGVWYHGARHDVDRLDTKKHVKGLDYNLDAGLMDILLGIHLAKDPNIANVFAGKGSNFEMGRMYPVHVNSKQPYRLPQRVDEFGKLLDSDSSSFEVDIAKKVFAEHPELLGVLLKDLGVEQGYTKMASALLRGENTPALRRAFKSGIHTPTENDNLLEYIVRWYGMQGLDHWVPLPSSKNKPLEDLELEEMIPWDHFMTMEYRRILEDAGFDSILYRNNLDSDSIPTKYVGPEEVPLSMVAFHPEQMKSIWNQKPTKDPRLMYGLAPIAMALGASMGGTEAQAANRQEAMSLTELQRISKGGRFHDSMWEQVLQSMIHHGINTESGELGQNLFRIMKERGEGILKRREYKNNVKLLEKGMESAWYTTQGLMADLAGGAGDIGSMLQFGLWEAFQKDGRGMWDKFTDTMTDGSWFFNSHSVEMQMRKSGFMENREATMSEMIARVLGNFLIPSGIPRMKFGTGGYLTGPSHAQGGIDLGVLGGVRHEAEGGEYIIRKEAVQRLGIGTLDHMNEHGNLPRNRRFVKGGITDLSPWPYGTSKPYLQMGADWTQVIGPKPDTSAAEAQMREAMYRGIVEGAERGAKEWAEIVSNTAAENIISSLEAHKERKAEFIADVDAAVARKVEETVALSLEKESLSGRTMDVTGAYQSQREASMAAQVSGYADAWQGEMYRRDRKRSLSEYHNLGMGSTERMPAPEVDNSLLLKEVLEINTAVHNIKVARSNALQKQSAIAASEDNYQSERSDAYRRFADKGESDRRMAEFWIAKDKKTAAREAVVDYSIGPEYAMQEVNAQTSFLWSEKYNNQYLKNAKAGVPASLGLTGKALLDKAENTALEARATDKSDMTTEGLREILGVEANINQRRDEIRDRRLAGGLSPEESSRLAFEFQELGQSLSALQPSIANWMNELEISDQMQDFIGSIDNAVLKHYASQIVQEERIITEEALNEKLKERFSGEDKYVKALADLEKKRFEKSEGNIFGVPHKKKDFGTRLEEGTAADAKKIGEALTVDNVVEKATGGVKELYKQGETSVQDYFKKRTTTINEKGEKETQYSGDPSVFNALTNYAEDAGDALLAVAKVIPGRVGQAANTFAAQIANGTDPIKAMGAAALQFVLSNEKVQKVLAKAGEVIEAILDPLIEMFLPVINVLVDSLKTFFEAIEPLIPLVKMLGEVIGNIARIAMGPANAVMGAVGQLVDGIAGALGMSTTPSQDEKDRQALKAIEDSMKSKNEELDKKYDGDLKTIADSYKDQYKAAAQIQDESMRAQAEAVIAETLNRERLMRMTELLTESFRSAADAISQAAESIGISTIDLASILTAEMIASEQAGGQNNLFTNPKQGRKTFTTAELLGEKGKSNGDPFMLGLIARAYGRDEMTFEDLREGFASSGDELADEKNWHKWTETVKHGTLGWVRHYHKYAEAVKNDNPLLDAILQETEDRMTQGKRDDFHHINTVISSNRFKSIESIVANKIGGLSYDEATDTWTYLGPILSDVTAMLISSFQEGATDMASINFSLEASEAALGRFKEALVGYVQDLIDRRGLVERSEYNLMSGGGFEDFASFYANAGKGGFEAQISAAVTAYNEKLTGGARGSDSLIRTVWEAATSPAGTVSEDQEAINQMAYNTLTAAEQELVSNVLSIMVERVKAFNDAMEDAISGLGRYTFAQQQVVEKTRFAESLVSQGFTQEQAENLMALFDEQQIINLQKHLLSLTEELRGMREAIAESTQSFSGLEYWFGGGKYEATLAGTVTQAGKIGSDMISQLGQSLLGLGIGIAGPTGISLAVANQAEEDDDPVARSNNRNSDVTAKLASTNENLIKAVVNNTMALQNQDVMFSTDQITLTGPDGNVMTLKEYNAAKAEGTLPAQDEEDTNNNNDLTVGQVPAWLKPYIQVGAGVNLAQIKSVEDLQSQLDAVLDPNLGYTATELMGMSDEQIAQLLDPSLQELAIRLQMLGLTFEQAESQITALNLSGAKAAFEQIASVDLDDGISAMLALQTRITEIINQGYDPAIASQMIEAERHAVAFSREDDLDQIDRRGRELQGVAQLNHEYNLQNQRMTSSIDLLQAKEELTVDEQKTLDYLLEKQEALTAARKREADVIFNDMLDGFQEQGVEYSELGSINKAFESNLQQITDAYNVDFSWTSLLEDSINGVSNGLATWEHLLGDISHLTEEQQAQVKALTNEAIAARNRALAQQAVTDQQEQINKLVNFFGITYDPYTMEDFNNAMKTLADVIESLEKTIEDLYYSDLNPIPMAEKLQSSELKYRSLYVAAVTPDEDGGFNQEAVETFQSYTNEYLTLNKTVWKSGMNYISALNKVKSDLQNVMGVIGVYETKTETDKLITALNELKEEINENITLWTGEDGILEKLEMENPITVIDEIIDKIESSLPSSLNSVYDSLVTAAGLANAELYLLSEMLNGPEGLTYHADYAAAGIDTMAETIKKKFDSIELLGIGVFSAMELYLINKAMDFSNIPESDLTEMQSKVVNAFVGVFGISVEQLETGLQDELDKFVVLGQTVGGEIIVALKNALLPIYNSEDAEMAILTKSIKAFKDALDGLVAVFKDSDAPEDAKDKLETWIGKIKTELDKLPQIFKSKDGDALKTWVADITTELNNIPQIFKDSERPEFNAIADWVADFKADILEIEDIFFVGTGENRVNLLKNWVTGIGDDLEDLLNAHKKPEDEKNRSYVDLLIENLNTDLAKISDIEIGDIDMSKFDTWVTTITGKLLGLLETFETDEEGKTTLENWVSGIKTQLGYLPEIFKDGDKNKLTTWVSDFKTQLESIPKVFGEADSDGNNALGQWVGSIVASVQKLITDAGADGTDSGAFVDLADGLGDFAEKLGLFQTDIEGFSLDSLYTFAEDGSKGLTSLSEFVTAMGSGVAAFGEDGSVYLAVETSFGQLRPKVIDGITNPVTQAITDMEENIPSRWGQIFGENGQLMNTIRELGNLANTELGTRDTGVLGEFSEFFSALRLWVQEEAEWVETQLGLIDSSGSGSTNSNSNPNPYSSVYPVLATGPFSHTTDDNKFHSAGDVHYAVSANSQGTMDQFRDEVYLNSPVDNLSYDFYEQDNKYHAVGYEAGNKGAGLAYAANKNLTVSDDDLVTHSDVTLNRETFTPSRDTPTWLSSAPDGINVNTFSLNADKASSYTPSVLSDLDIFDGYDFIYKNADGGGGYAFSGMSQEQLYNLGKYADDNSWDYWSKEPDLSFQPSHVFTHIATDTAPDYNSVGVVGGLHVMKGVSETVWSTKTQKELIDHYESQNGDAPSDHALSYWYVGENGEKKGALIFFNRADGPKDYFDMFLEERGGTDTYKHMIPASFEEQEPATVDTSFQPSHVFQKISHVGAQNYASIGTRQIAIMEDVSEDVWSSKTQAEIIAEYEKQHGDAPTNHALTYWYETDGGDQKAALIFFDTANGPKSYYSRFLEENGGTDTYLHMTPSSAADGVITGQVAYKYMRIPEHNRNQVAGQGDRISIQYLNSNAYFDTDKPEEWSTKGSATRKAVKDALYYEARRDGWDDRHASTKDWWHMTLSVEKADGEWRADLWPFYTHEWANYFNSIDTNRYYREANQLSNFEKGGYLQGPSHKNGGIPIEAEGGEYIIRKSAVASLGVPYLDYLNEEGGLPFMRFGMGEFLKQDQEVGIAEVSSSDGELKTLIRELIQAIREGDKDITEAIEELEVVQDINVYTDLEGEVRAQLYAYDEKIKESSKRGLNPRR